MPSFYPDARRASTRYLPCVSGPLFEQRSYTSPLSPEALREAARAVVEPTAWPPALILKLSGGGIVSRVIDAPATPLPFFGQVEAPSGGMRLVLSSRGQETTPFQPLLLLDIAAEDAGSRVTLTLRPHRESGVLSGLFVIFGVIVALAALPALLQGQPIALIALAVGAAAVLFPPLRARLSFQADRDRALAALETHLPLSRIPDPAATPPGHE